jgi:ribonuclease P protein component
MVGTLNMLRSPLDFQALQSGSRSRTHHLFTLRYRRNELDATRYGISTGRRIGPAVVRNRVRRRLRTLLRSLGPAVAPGWDVLIVARPASAAASQAQLGEALERLLRGAGIIGGTTIE